MKSMTNLRKSIFYLQQDIKNRDGVNPKIDKKLLKALDLLVSIHLKESENG